MRRRNVTLALAAAALAGSVGVAGKPPAPGVRPRIVTTKTGIQMVLLPGGSFLMGSDKGAADEKPPHRVWVHAFSIDRTEVTQEQFGKLVLGNPSHFKGAQRPMEETSWARAAIYCNARSRAEGLQPCYDEDTAECNFQADGYRLPTEAEWEYACRAGTKTDYFFGDEAGVLGRYAWYHANAGEQTHPVGQKKPNPWGLFDMLGNVAEWCNDVYADNYYAASPGRNPRGAEFGDNHVVRGGSWSSSAEGCRVARRFGANPGFQDACYARDDIGFRCVRPWAAPAKP